MRPSRETPDRDVHLICGHPLGCLCEGCDCCEDCVGCHCEED